MLRNFFMILATALIVAACATTGTSGKKDKKGLDYGANAREAYLAALEDLRSGDCLDAEPAFRKIRREFPYSRFAALSELRIADCLMLDKKYAEAIQAYRQFTRFRPSHSQVPYARFRIAEAHYEQIPNEWLLSPPAYERDQGPTRDALRQLRRFVLDFPDDERIPEARKMMTDALTMLAQHELYVARFYLDRDAPKATVQRLRLLLNTYQGSKVEPEAWLLLGRTYLDMKERHEARQAFEELVRRFPESQEAASARRHLGKLGPGVPRGAAGQKSATVAQGSGDR